jgi:hypothetical protein
MIKNASSHSEDRPFKCKLCKYSAKLKDQLKIHTNSVHCNEKLLVTCVGGGTGLLWLDEAMV